MTLYRGRPPAPTLADVGEPQPEPPPRPQRTPVGDALIFGTGCVLWAGLIAVGGHLLSLRPLWWTVGTVAVGVLACVVARLALGTRPLTMWWVSVLAAAFGWLAWARWADLRAPAPWLGLAAGAAVLLAAYPLLVAHEMKAGERARWRAEAAARAAVENRWPRLLERIGHPGVTVTGKEDTRNGYVLALRLPGSGKVTWKQLIRDLERLEVAADARHGSLRLERGEGARDVLLYVSTVDVLAETVPYVDDGKPMSIRNPIPIGLYEDGTVCSLTLREVCLLIVGLRGSGKSNLLNVLLAGLVRCVDCLVFLNDTKHRLALPWVQPYLADERNGKAINWVATDRAETELMLRADLNAIKQRAASASGEEKIEPTPQEPAVVNVFDEVASVFGEGRGPRFSSEGTTNMTLAGIGAEAIQVGRSEAVDFILATQRGTVTMTGGGDLKSQCSVSIGLRVKTEADARLVFPDDTQAAQLLASLKHEGTGLLMEDAGGRVAPVKFFRITPEQITEIARRYGPLKPAPDVVLERALGEAYQDRWERFRAARKAARALPVPDTQREFAAIAARLGDVEEAGDEVTAARQRMRDFMARSGDRGVTVSMITSLLKAEHMETSERTVRRWLDADIRQGVAERVSHLVYRARKRDGE